jgi:PIN domain nuclease of toxin-antitoxin system
MNLLLDTHAFIWWDDDYARLPDSLLVKLRDPQHIVYLSLASIWEMQIKIQLGKIEFTIPLSQKIRDNQLRNKLQLLPIAEAHLYALGDLPHHHRDPFDRVLIAQSRTESLTLVTNDSNIRRYDVTTLWDEHQS